MREVVFIDSVLDQKPDKQLLKRCVPDPLADPIHSGMKLRCPGLRRNDRVCGRHSEVVVAVDAEGGMCRLLDLFYHEIRGTRIKNPYRVCDAQVIRVVRLGDMVDPFQYIHICAGRILGSEPDRKPVILCIVEDIDCAVGCLIDRHVMLVAQLDVRRCNKDAHDIDIRIQRGIDV